MTSPTRTIAALILTCAVAGSGLAQTPPPAAAALDASKCEKPDPHPGRLASNEKMKQWNKEVATWQDCMKKYVAEVQARADVAVKAANAAVAESNAAVNAFNSTIKELQSQVDAAK
ncbi:MAG: hypothetical protein ABI624_15355 [Casimicrobiaceae bacterium]